MADSGHAGLTSDAGGLTQQFQGGEAGPNAPGYVHHQAAQNQALQEQLRKFWYEMGQDVDNTGTDPADFKTQQLPLARIKKIMKSDEDVRMISAEAPVLFAKACEFFILELTLRSWAVAEETKRRTLQRSDAAVAIARTEVLDFLMDTVPQEEGAGDPADGTTGPTPATSAQPAAAAAPSPAQQQVPMFQPHHFMAGGAGPPPGSLPPQQGVMFQPGVMPPAGMFMPAMTLQQQQQQFAMMAAAAQHQQAALALAQAQAQQQLAAAPETEGEGKE